jgi:PAS domain S-box-containing protein
VVGAFGVIQDITDRKTIELDLRNSEERLRLALEAAGMAVWDWDMRSGQDVWNAQSYRMIGYEPGEIAPGFETWQRHIHPDDRDTVTAQYKRSLELGTDVANENRIIDRFGNVKWVAARGRTVCDPSGRPMRSFGVITDITERKQAEERDRLLTAEVNHRAKNLLAVVQAVAIQTARHCQHDQFVEAFDERLKSLAASHDLLVSTKWQGVEIGSLVRSQLSHFADLIDRRIFLDGPKAEILPDAAQAIGLAIHELVTNAAKYGALSSSIGKIDVTWSMVKSEGKEPGFLIRWQEAGGPPVAKPERRGFGHSILVGMVEYSTGATVELTFPPTGLVWQLLAPAHVVLRPGRA